jgi:hypothetical protein
MPDVLSQGGDREPSRWRRRLVAAVILAVLLTVVVLRLPHHRHSPPPAGVTVGPVPPRDSSPPPVPPVPGEPSGIIGHTLRWTAGLRLPVTGVQPVWFSPATGRREVIGGLPPNRAGYQFVRLGGGWAVQPGSAARPGCASCASPPSPVYFLGDSARSATRIGSADQVAPAAVPGAMWLTSYPPDVSLGRAAGIAQEVRVTGAPLHSQVRLPPGYAIDQATDGGLLLSPSVQRPGTTTDLLWDPSAPGAGRMFAAVIAASASRIAWAPRCATACRIHVLDLTTGRATLVGLPAGSSVDSAAFSPDGGFLALQVSAASGGDGGGTATQLEVAAAATGRLTMMPGTGTSSDALVGFGWPAESDRLVAEFSFTTRVQVASWRPGGTRLAVAILRPGQTSASIVVG